MKTIISVIICTHNPRRDYLDRVINSLKIQTLPKAEWEFLLIDNASDSILSTEIDITWHPQGRHIREDNLGLTAARLRAFKEAVNEIIVFVDDDNVIEENYLKNTAEILQLNPYIGAIGGKSIAEFETEPEYWFHELGISLGCRDLGEEIKVCSWTQKDIENKKYPDFAPIGAGLVLRKTAFATYFQRIQNNIDGLSLGRTGKKLTSGEDNDIVMTLLESGWSIGYFPQLKLTHLIPKNRLTKEYLAGIKRAINRSWVQVLDMHGIRPWKKISRWTLLPRKLKAFFIYQAWKNEASYILWQGACGIFEGQANLFL